MSVVTGKKLWITLAAACVLAQLPFLWLLARHHDEAGFRRTLAQVVAHAPNQFLFLPLLFPLVAFATGHLWCLLLEWSRRYPADFARSQAWRSPRWLLPVFLLLSLLLALTDSGALRGSRPDPAGGTGWLPDWYQLSPWEAVRGCAEANQALVRTNCLRELGGDQAPPLACEAHTASVRTAYVEAEGVDGVLLYLEAIELTAVAMVVGLAFLGAAICARFRLAATEDRERFKYSAQLRLSLINGVRPLLVLSLSFTCFVAMRSQSRAEMRAVFPGYETIDPRLLLVGILVLLGFATVIRFGTLDSGAKAVAESLVGVVGSLTIGLFAWKPSLLSEALHDMGSTGNWILMGFIGGFALFAAVAWIRAPTHLGEA